jgi:hypothetical protein
MRAFLTIHPVGARPGDEHIEMLEAPYAHTWPEVL